MIETGKMLGLSFGGLEPKIMQQIIHMEVEEAGVAADMGVEVNKDNKEGGKDGES